MRFEYKPAFDLPPPFHLTCTEDKFESLLGALVNNQVDLFLSYAPALPTADLPIVSHPLGESAVALFAKVDMAGRYRRHYPESLKDAPMLLPTPCLPLRSALDRWFSAQGIRPTVRGEFDDTSLMRLFGEQGFGIFPMAGVVRDLLHDSGVRLVGHVDSVCERYYANFIRSQGEHPAVAAIVRGGAHSFA
jgi:LysR family transcriptional activator of nhaA